jgi:hypothetical protein
MSKRKEPEKPTGGDSIPVPVQATPVQPTPITPTISTVPPAYNGEFFPIFGWLWSESNSHYNGD